MNFTQQVFELINMRSFSNLWYWIALAVLWSTSSHWVLGVPYDLVQRARRQGGEAAEDVADLVRINARRYLYIMRVSGLWISAFAGFALTMLAMMGFLYGNEFSQAVFLLLAPLTLVGLWTLRTAYSYEQRNPSGERLYWLLRWHRLGIQMMGILSILVTAMWGMWQNFTIGVLGG